MWTCMKRVSWRTCSPLNSTLSLSVSVSDCGGESCGTIVSAPEILPGIANALGGTGRSKLAFLASSPALLSSVILFPKSVLDLVRSAPGFWNPPVPEAVRARLDVSAMGLSVSSAASSSSSWTLGFATMSVTRSCSLLGLGCANSCKTVEYHTRSCRKDTPYWHLDSHLFTTKTAYIVLQCPRLIAFMNTIMSPLTIDCASSINLYFSDTSATKQEETTLNGTVIPNTSQQQDSKHKELSALDVKDTCQNRIYILDHTQFKDTLYCTALPFMRTIWWNPCPLQSAIDKESLIRSKKIWPTLLRTSGGLNALAASFSALVNIGGVLPEVIIRPEPIAPRRGEAKGRNAAIFPGDRPTDRQAFTLGELVIELLHSHAMKDMTKPKCDARHSALHRSHSHDSLQKPCM